MLNTCQGSAAVIPHFKLKVSNMRHKRQWSEWISTEVSNKTNSRTEGRKNPTSCLRKPQRGNAVSCIWGRRDIFFIITGHQNWQQICFVLSMEEKPSLRRWKGLAVWNRLKLHVSTNLKSTFWQTFWRLQEGNDIQRQQLPTRRRRMKQWIRTNLERRRPFYF